MQNTHPEAFYSIIAHGISGLMVKELLAENKYGMRLDYLDSVFYVNPSLGCTQNPFYSSMLSWISHLKSIEYEREQQVTQNDISKSLFNQDTNFKFHKLKITSPQIIIHGN